MRLCSVPGCQNKHRARGLCSTHYNQTKSDRHAAAPVACSNCGTTVRRAHKADRRPVCSVACRTALQHGCSSEGYDHVKAGMKRAKAAGAQVIEPVDRFEVFARDSWTCYLCDKRLDPGEPAFSPDSATVDHVVPLSQGGQHVMDNVRCACLRCNSSKSDRLLAA